MKTINEIFIACQEQQPLTEEELRLGLLCYGYMQMNTERALDDLVEKVLGGTGLARLQAKLQEAEREHRFKARKGTPSHYLGKNWTPGTPENNASRRMSKNIARKAGIDI